MKEKSTKEKKRKTNQLLTNKAVLILISYILTDPFEYFFASDISGINPFINHLLLRVKPSKLTHSTRHPWVHPVICIMT